MLVVQKIDQLVSPELAVMMVEALDLHRFDG